MTEAQIRSTIQPGCIILLKEYKKKEYIVEQVFTDHINLKDLSYKYKYSEIQTIVSWPIPKELNDSHVNHWIRIKTAEENPNPYDHTKDMVHMYGKWGKIKTTGWGHREGFVLYEELGYRYYPQDIAAYRPIPVEDTGILLKDVPINSFIKLVPFGNWYKVTIKRPATKEVSIYNYNGPSWEHEDAPVAGIITNYQDIPDDFVIRPINSEVWLSKKEFQSKGFHADDIAAIMQVFDKYVSAMKHSDLPPKELTLADVALGSLVKFYGWDGWFKFDSKLPDETCILFQNNNEKRLPSSNPIAEVLTSLSDIPDHYLIRPMYQTEWRTKKAFLDAGFGMRMVAAIRGSDRGIPCGEIPLDEPQPCVLSHDKNKKQEDKLMLDTLDQIKEAELTPELLEKAAQETKRIRDDKAAQEVQAKQQRLLDQLDSQLCIKKENDKAIANTQALLAALGYPPKGK